MLPDGIYDAFILSADAVNEKKAVSVELVVTAGPRRGDVVVVVVHQRSARDASGDTPVLPAAEPDALVGLPCRLTVEDGRPRLHS